MQLLSNILIVFAISIVVLFICLRLRIPAIVGYLLAGILIGPSSFRIITDLHQVETLAEIGVILLLFTIGMEFSLNQLLQLRKTFLIGGFGQVLLTIAASSLLVVQLGLPLNQAVFAGFLVALSSTAIVMKTLQEKAEVDSPHGRISLGILIFQDIVIVPMILITPLLAGKAGDVNSAVLIMLAKGIGIVGLVIIATKWIVPHVLYQITRTRSTELFLLSIVVICFSVAWLTYLAGLSLALGAFLAGLIISETEYSHAALGNVIPFQSVFTTFFFISIGMMLDIGFFIQRPHLILLIALIVMSIKFLIAGGIAMILRYPLRTAVLVGCALCQLGEFSFVLSRVGIENGLFSESDNQTLLSVAIISMALTPLIINLAHRFAESVVKLQVRLNWVKSAGFKTTVETEIIKGHLVIIGFGLVGRNVANAAKKAGIPYFIVEMNPETVRIERKKGEPIYYGDATHPAVLEHAGVNNARIAVIAINDPTATRRITEIVRRLNRSLCIIVRTRYVQEVKMLYNLGADEVIPEEFETSVEIFARILNKFLVPKNDIEKMVADVRASGYEALRQPVRRVKGSLADLEQHLDEIEITALRIMADSPLIDRTLGEVELRKKYGISVVAVRRDEEMLANPGSEITLFQNDILYILATHEQVSDVSVLFQPIED